MHARALILGLGAIFVAAPALANHGKVGLWNVTSSTDVVLPAKLKAQMKQAGMASMPGAQPITVQMCMSKAEVESNAPPHIDSGASGCTTRIVSQTADAMRATTVCKGRMNGTGSIEVSYKGAEHYSGSYSFTGTPMTMKTSFKGDWVKADCGKVQPYRLRTQR
jgi:hypothetical protein